MKKEERQLYLYNLKHKTDENGELLKQCSICEEWFPCELEYFYKNKSNHMDGLNPYCKKCTNNKFKEWITNNQGKSSATGKAYRAGHKKERKEWHKHYYLETKEDHQRYLKNWQGNNPEKLKQYSSFYSNKKHDISNKEWILCKEYFNNSCAYCGLPIEEHFTIYGGITKQGDFHKEHVNCEGEGNLQNCVPSCRTCNTSKHKENMEGWYVEQEFYSKEKLDKIHQWINEDYKLYIEEKIELPYIIKRVKNSEGNNYYFELWSKDNDNNAEIHLATENKKKELDVYIQKYFSGNGRL